MADAPFIEVIPGRCWWCQDVADTREHRLKKSDLVREYGPAPFDGLRTLTRFSGGNRTTFSGPKSKVVQFDLSMCARCNNVRSQPFDQAWDQFVTFLAENEKEILRSRQLDLRGI